jgi:hypothetical protein
MAKTQSIVLGNLTQLHPNIRPRNTLRLCVRRDLWKG